MKIWKNICYYVETSALAMSTFVVGVYVASRVNYLDDPRVTPFPPPVLYREALGFTDDWWFATLLIVVSLVIMLGVMFNKLKIIVPMMVVLSGIFATLMIEFMLRGVFSYHSNVSWGLAIFAELWTVFTIRRLGKGGGRNQR